MVGPEVEEPEFMDVVELWLVWELRLLRAEFHCEEPVLLEVDPDPW